MTAYYLTITTPIYDNYDAIRGSRTTRLTEFGTFETQGYAHALADRLHDEWCLDLGDGAHITVKRCDGQKIQPAPAIGWLGCNDFELPF
ncbi:hypothetical protein [Burkholderia anthina]|uniref:hypothetical protein n=1 Tax=Burkholderia anthina TaxID=179879 RepID=UPI0015888BAF|nr:hypothetical protein [Burkholderia anthina]